MNIFKRGLVSFTIITLLAFFGCRNSSNDQESLSKEEVNAYTKVGGELASSTQKVLATNLVGAIREKGTEGALAFCNIQAIPLTDSMSVVLEAHIKRVTDQPRNPNNLANDSELQYIRSAKDSLREGTDISPSIQYHNGKVIGYYPIITNQLCMQCHGSEGDQIEHTTLTKIKELYPDDKATGYDIGELRGIWVVEMKKDSLK